MTREQALACSEPKLAYYASKVLAERAIDEIGAAHPDVSIAGGKLSLGGFAIRRLAENPKSQSTPRPSLGHTLQRLSLLRAMSMLSEPTFSSTTHCFLATVPRYIALGYSGTLMSEMLLEQ